MQYITFVLLFFLPFVVLPFGVSHFETLKVLLAEVLIITLLVWIFIQKGFYILAANKYQIALLTLLFLLSLYHLLFQATDATFFGNDFRMQGVFLLWLLMGCSLVSAQITLPKIPRYVFLLLLIATGTFSLLVMGNVDRAVGTLGEPNALASWAVFLWPFAFFRIMKLESGIMNKKHKYSARLLMLLFSVFLAALIILLSGSRSGIVAFAIQGIVLLLLHFKTSFRKAVIVGVVLVAASMFLPFLQTNPYENRVAIWKTATIAGYENWLFGFGFGNTEFALQEYGDRLYTGNREYYVDSSHNMFLDFWVQGGFVGLSAIVLLVYFSFRQFIKQQNRLLFVLFLGVVTVMLFNPVSIVTLVQFWWLIGKGFGKLAL